MTRTSSSSKTIRDLLLDPMQKHVEPTVGAIGHTRMFAKGINEAERTIEFICSTATLDRYGERVLPEAFADSLDSFMANPAFPFGHSYDLTPGGQLPTVGHWRSMRVTDDALIGVAWFKPWGLGEECWRDYLDGNLTSVSVAFLTRGWRMDAESDEDGTQRRVRVFTAVDLLECSAVLIPANPQARIRAASAGLLPGVGGTSGANDLQSMIDRAVQRALSQHLDAGPDGHLRTLGLAPSARGHTGYLADGYLSEDFAQLLDMDPDDQDDDAAGDPDGEGDELKGMIRELLG